VYYTRLFIPPLTHTPQNSYAYRLADRQTPWSSAAAALSSSRQMSQRDVTKRDEGQVILDP